MTPPEAGPPSPDGQPPGLDRLVGSDGAIQRVRLAAYGWCPDADRLLLCRISEQGPGGGRWTLPGGGTDFGEDPVDAVLRELREETGLEGLVGDLLGVRSAVLEPAETISGHRVQTVGVLYRVAITGGDLRSEVDGSTDLARWVPRANVVNLPLDGLATWALRLVGA